MLEGLSGRLQYNLWLLHSDLLVDGEYDYLFKAYFDVDVTEGWKWDNYYPPQAKKVLNEFISKRGDAAHQANTSNSQSHLIKRDELEKAIRFLKGLVRA